MQPKILIFTFNSFKIKRGGSHICQEVCTCIASHIHAPTQTHVCTHIPLSAQLAYLKSCSQMMTSTQPLFSFQTSTELVQRLRKLYLKKFFLVKCQVFSYLLMVSEYLWEVYLPPLWRFAHLCHGSLHTSTDIWIPPATSTEIAQYLWRSASSTEKLYGGLTSAYICKPQWRCAESHRGYITSVQFAGGMQISA